MVVGDDVAIGGEYDSRAGPCAFGGLYLALLLASASTAEEVAEEILKGVTILDGLGAGVDGDLDVDNRIDCVFGGIGEVNGVLRSRCSGGGFFTSEGHAQGESQHGQ